MATRLYKRDLTVEFDKGIEDRINNMTGYNVGLYEIVSAGNLRIEKDVNKIYYVADLKKHKKYWNGMAWVESTNTSTFIVEKIGDVYAFDNRDKEGMFKLYGAIVFDSNCNIVERLPWSWERCFMNIEQLKGAYL